MTFIKLLSIFSLVLIFSTSLSAGRTSGLTEKKYNQCMNKKSPNYCLAYLKRLKDSAIDKDKIKQIVGRFDTLCDEGSKKWCKARSNFSKIKNETVKKEIYSVFTYKVKIRACADKINEAKKKNDLKNERNSAFCKGNYKPMVVTDWSCQKGKKGGTSVSISLGGKNPDLSYCDNSEKLSCIKIYKCKSMLQK